MSFLVKEEWCEIIIETTQSKFDLSKKLMRPKYIISSFFLFVNPGMYLWVCQTQVKWGHHVMPT